MNMRVPGYERQVQRQVAPHTPQTTDAYGGIAANQTLQVAKGFEGAAEGFDKVAEQQANTEVFNAEAQARKDWIAVSADLQKNRQGVNAVGVTKDVEKWWDENKAKYLADKSPRAASMIEHAIGRQQAGAMEQFKNYEFQQGEQAAKAAVEANVHSAVSSMAANPSVDNIALQRTGIDAALRKHAADNGWAPEVLNDKLATAHSAGTIAAFNTLFARNPKEARDFWAANRETVRGEQRDEIETRLKSGLAGVEANEFVDGVWKTMGPKRDIDPVEIDKMAASVREKFRDQPETQKAALQTLKERAAEHNAAQAERAAGATNEVMAIWNSTKSLDKVKRSQAWAALPAGQQTKIEEHVNNLLWQNEQRALTREQRALTAANRDVVNMQRQQQRLHLQGYARYQELSEPTKLASMSDAQVRAELPNLGNELTDHLLTKYRALKANASEVRTAAMDKQDFESIAHEFKLEPYKDKKTEEEKARLGMLQSRVELLIDAAQRTKGKPLDRLEKQAIMRNEMGKQVLVNPGLFSSNVTRPVIALTPEDATNVVIPPTELPKLREALKAKKLPDTDANLKYLYLRGKSRATDLVVQ